jgi:hypothetical protein
MKSGGSAWRPVLPRVSTQCLSISDCTGNRQLAANPHGYYIPGLVSWRKGELVANLEEP